MRMISAKEISGGRTWVDRGTLEAGFPYGGLVPKGRRSEDGIVPEKFDQMVEDGLTRVKTLKKLGNGGGGQ